MSLTLGRLPAVLNEAVRRKLVVRNVAAHTKIPGAARKAAAAAAAEEADDRGTAEVRALLVGIREVRLFPIMLLSLMGMRPAEMLGVLVGFTTAVALARMLVSSCSRPRPDGPPRA